MRNRPDTAMIFCAGRGTRMKALTQDRPKPLIEVAGRPLIDHALEQLEHIPRKIANLHYLPDLLEKHLKFAGLETIFEPELLETGGGLKNALPVLKRDIVYTMNTDAVWKGPRAADVLAQAWNPNTMDALLLVVPKTRAKAHLGQGDFDILPGGHLARGRTTVYTGAQILKTNPLDQIKDHHFSLNVLWEVLFEKKRIFGVIYPGYWCDVGHPDGVGVAERLIEEN